MKSTEVRQAILDWLTSLSPVANLDVPYKERGTNQVQSSVMVAPSFLVENTQEPVYVGYPVQIVWRFPSTLRYHQLPLGIVDSLLIFLMTKGGLCNSDIRSSLGESEIDVSKLDDGQDWIVSLKFVVLTAFFWESETDYKGLIPNPESSSITINEVSVNYSYE